MKIRLKDRDLCN